MELKLDLMREMYQAISIAERIDYMILEEKYNKELYGIDYVNEGVGDSIKEGFEKFINTVKSILKKIVHFVTVTIPGAIKKFFNAIISLFKKKHPTVILVPKGTIQKMQEAAKKNNSIQKMENTVVAANTVVAVNAAVKQDKPSESEDSVKTTTNQKSDIEKIKELRKKIDMEKQDWDKIMKEAAEAWYDNLSPSNIEKLKKAISEMEKAAKQGKTIQVVEEGETPKKLVGYKGIFYDENYLGTALGGIEHCNSWFSSVITDCFAKVSKDEGYNSYISIREDWTRIRDRVSNTISKVNGSKMLRTVKLSEFERVKTYLPEMDKAIKKLSGDIITLQKYVNKLTIDQWKKTSVVPKTVNALISLSNSVVSISSNFSLEVSKTITAFAANSSPVYE